MLTAIRPKANKGTLNHRELFIEFPQKLRERKPPVDAVEVLTALQEASTS
jgi:hypothetical protein